MKDYLAIGNSSQKHMSEQANDKQQSKIQPHYNLQNSE